MAIEFIYTGKNYDEEQLERIKVSNRPCVVWGKGDLANNVIKLLKSHGKRVDYVYTNIQSPEEKELEIEEIEDLSVFGDDCEIDLVMGHARYEFAESIKEQYHNIKDVYMFSNPFETHDRVTSKDYLDNNMSKFEDVYNILEDEISKDNLIAYINARINKDVRYIKNYSDKNYFNNSVFSVDENESYVDIGAYDGDTIRTFIRECGGKYRHIYALEPEGKAYERLEKYIKTNSIDRVSLYMKGCYNKQCLLSFDSTADTSSKISAGGGITIEVDRLDNMISDKVTIIKIAQQGPVEEIIAGSERIIKEYNPKLAVCVGVDVSHLFNIPLLIKRMNTEYKIYLRFLGRLPSRLIMFGVQK